MSLNNKQSPVFRKKIKTEPKKEEPKYLIDKIEEI